MQHERRDLDAAGEQVIEHPLRERAAGARHLGAARLVGEDGLEVAQRARAGDVAVGDRAPVLGEVAVERRGEVERGDPQPPGREVGRDQLRRPTGGQREALPGAGRAEARAGTSQLDDPPRSARRFDAVAGRGEHPPSRRLDGTRHRGREVEVDGSAVRARGGERGGDGGGGVDDEQVARAQLGGQVAEAVVDEREPVALGDEQAHLVALEPARLGRRARLVGGCQRERERGAHARDSSSAPAA